MLFYRFFRGLFRLLAAPMFRFRVQGVERIPREGAGVIVAPHRSWLDPACVGGACPRPIRFLIMDRVYHSSRTHWFYRGLRSIPVATDGSDSIRALRAALRALKRGELVGIFPEGRVFSEEEPGPIHPGAALLAVRARVPVVPLFIRGSSRAWPHGQRFPRPAPVSVRVGQAIDPPEQNGREGVAEMIQRIQGAWDRLAGEEDR